jgi:hypothetical protein
MAWRLKNDIILWRPTVGAVTLSMVMYFQTLSVLLKMAILCFCDV